MKYCNFCGKQLDSNATFCTSCGNKAIETPKTSSDSLQDKIREKLKKSKKAKTESLIADAPAYEERVELTPYTKKLQKVLGGASSKRVISYSHAVLIASTVTTCFMLICLLCGGMNFSYVSLGLFGCAPVVPALLYFGLKKIYKSAKVPYKMPNVTGQKMLTVTCIARFALLCVLLFIGGTVVLARYLWTKGILNAGAIEYTSYFSNLIRVLRLEEVYIIICRNLVSLLSEISFLSLLTLTAAVFYAVFVFLFHIKAFRFTSRQGRSLVNGCLEKYETITFGLLIATYAVLCLLLGVALIVISMVFASYITPCTIIAFILAGMCYIVKSFFFVLAFKLFKNIQSVE